MRACVFKREISNGEMGNPTCKFSKLFSVRKWSFSGWDIPLYCHISIAFFFYGGNEEGGYSLSEVLIQDTFRMFILHSVLSRAVSFSIVQEVMNLIIESFIFFHIYLPSLFTTLTRKK